MAHTSLSQLEHDLQTRFEKFQRSNAYEIFDLWEGCGRDAVQARYYELVKVHHPDRYGGNMTSRLKKLSQSIFLQIQDAYQNLGRLEDGPQRVGPPEQERAKALGSLSTAKPSKRTPVKESSQYKRMRRTGINERLSNKAIFEAVSISERDASTLEEDSLPEEERRAKLAKLARTARAKAARPPITQVLAHQGSLEEDSSLSIQERRDKLAELSARKKHIPSSFSMNERTPTAPSLSVDSVPLADVASSGTIRGLSTQQARQHVAQDQQDFSTGVHEMREARYKNAFKFVKSAYHAKPDDPRYRAYYAYLLFMTDANKAQEAEEMLREVVKLGNKQIAPDAHLFLGCIHKASDRTNAAQRALKHFKKALELNPSNHEAAREVRLYEMRSKQESSPRLQDDVGGFFKRLFKK